jgi:glucose-1-phosphate cytidylyltransferase
MIRNPTPVMILAGGLGTRLREETEYRPKPMVPIGGRPVLWHIMKIYSHYGYYRFIICLGYKGNTIKNYFLNNRLDGVDFTVNTKTGSIIEHQINTEEWEVTLVETGENTMTGSRIAQAARYVDGNTFMLTYGDGLADINIQKLHQFHTQHKKAATLTGVNLVSRFGNLEVVNNQVTAFAEKNTIETAWINGGFMVLEKDFLSYLSTNPNCVLEQEPFKQAAQDKQLMMFQHPGFWQCMDTYREYQILEELWQKGAPWKVWQHDLETFSPAKKETTSWPEQSGNAPMSSNS